MDKSVELPKAEVTPEPPKTRAPWQPLVYEKLEFAQAQTPAHGIGADASFYS